MNKSFLFCIAIFCVVAVAFASSGDEHYSGDVFQNSYIHEINLNEPQDANRVLMDVIGEGREGEVSLHIDGPATLCPNGLPGSCGRNVANISLVLESHHGKVSLKSFVQYPANGVAFGLKVVGTWVKEALQFMLSYTVRLVLPDGRIVTVPIKAQYAGRVDKNNNRFIGHQYGFVIPYRSDFYNGTDPYQFLATYGAIDSFNSATWLAGYRVLSPLVPLANPGYPPSPTPVSGTIDDSTIDAAQLKGLISLHEPTGKANFTGAAFHSAYHWIDRTLDFALIPLGYANGTDVNGVFRHWILENLFVDLKEF